MTGVPIARQWVGRRDSARRAARASIWLALRRPQLWVSVAVIELIFAVMFGVLFDDRYGIATRVVWGPVYALLPSLLGFMTFLAMGYLITLGSSRRMFREGVVLESGFGEDSLVLRTPGAETTLSFDGLRSVRVRGDWVFLQRQDRRSSASGPRLCSRTTT